jgi:hypothetical protein
MLKRTIAGFLGSLAVAGGCFASYEAVQFICVMAVSGRPVLSWWFQGLLGWFLAVPALVFGVHFLRFAIFPVTVVDPSWRWRMFVGANFFFPGFVFSLPLTLVAARFWLAFAPDVFPNLAFIVSIAIGLLAAVGGCIFLLRRGAGERVPQSDSQRRR